MRYLWCCDHTIHIDHITGVVVGMNSNSHQGKEFIVIYEMKYDVTYLTIDKRKMQEMHTCMRIRFLTNHGKFCNAKGRFHK